MFGVCHLSAIPCRREPSEKSEMVTQLLFGEAFRFIDQKGQWQQIVNAADQYEGWVDRNQFLPVSREIYAELMKNPAPVAGELFQLVTDQTSGETFPIALGSSLPFYKKGVCTLGDRPYIFEGTVREFPSKPERNNIVETALLYRNAPYLWGGKTPFGLDCSGFMQVVFKANGVQLKRDAWQQAEAGNSCTFVEEALPGDLAFFDNEEGRIVHVGIIIGDNRIIHASGRVRIDHYDHYGIFTPERGGYTHNLRVIKQLIQ
ncbi:MAG TPA: C40 family peptidase [Bacteroidia bacterium]|nr:C40 family peptidase [Bacteroidia bacterium]